MRFTGKLALSHLTAQSLSSVLIPVITRVASHYRLPPPGDADAVTVTIAGSHEEFIAGDGHPQGSGDARQDPIVSNVVVAVTCGGRPSDYC